MTLKPQEAAEKMLTLSEEQSRLTDKLIELEEMEARWFSENRDKYKSDTATKNAWKTTIAGRDQNRLNLKMKAIKSELSTIKNYLRHCENVGRGIY